MIKFSVIICTRNRASYLSDALRSVCEQDFPSDAFEIIIVDNGSTDETHQVASRFAADGFPCKYVFEPILGLPSARNTGAKVSIGEFLVFLDDDALADSNWLTAWEVAHQQTSNQLAILGGRSELFWECKRPDWITDDLLPYLSDTTHLGQIRKTLEIFEYPVGVNFSIKRNQLIKIGGFDSRLTPYGNDEIELCRRVRYQGGVVIYAPEARVKHRVGCERISLSYFLHRFYLQGVADIGMELRVIGIRKPTLLKSSFALILQIVVDAAKVLYWAVRSNRILLYHRVLTLVGRTGRLKSQLELLI
jgi:glucosyl-dolichyl phosphate glucuronosyltransferase